MGTYCQIAGSHGSVLLIFWGISILFSIVAALVYIPANSAQGFLLSIPLPTLVISCLFDNYHSNRCLTIKLSTPENLSLLILSKISPPFILSQLLSVFCIALSTITFICLSLSYVLFPAHTHTHAERERRVYASWWKYSMFCFTIVELLIQHLTHSRYPQIFVR